jgi:hypothetical protein
MAQTAFILILPSDEPKGQRLHDLLRERHGHSCRVVATLDDALNSIRVRAVRSVAYRLIRRQPEQPARNPIDLTYRSFGDREDPAIRPWQRVALAIGLAC